MGASTQRRRTKARPRRTPSVTTGQVPKQRYSSKPGLSRHERAEQRKQKRSDLVAYGVMGAIALACCGGAAYEQFFQRQTCVDNHNVVLADDECHHPRGGTGAHWYYGGRNNGIGSVATDGSVERGGFGRLFSGRG